MQTELTADRFHRLLAAWLFAMLVCAPACAAPNDLPQPSPDTAIKLLNTGYEVASSYPLVPHIKNRSSAQQIFVSAALQLDQPARAVEYAHGIANFRRGLSFAQIAHYYAERDRDPLANAYIKFAKDVAEGKDVEEWRTAKIYVAVARAYAELEEREKAKELLTHEVLALSGEAKLAAEILQSFQGTFEQMLKVYQQYQASEEFEGIKAAVWGYGNLYRQYHEEPEKRDKALALLIEAAKVLPPELWSRSYLDLASFSLEHDDAAKARELITLAKGFIEAYDPPAVVSIPYEARLAGLLHRAGEQEAGDELLQTVLSDFEKGLDGFKTLDRAGLKRSIAEAYVAMGQDAKAQEAYSQVFTLMLVNPNLRPRITDFTAACVSLALNGLEPDPKLWASIEKARKEIIKP